MLDFKELFVKADSDLNNVMLAMSKGIPVAIVVDDNDVLSGFITDGDIRRHFVNKGSLTDVAGSLMSVNPVTANPDMSAAEVLSLMEQFKITYIPYIDESRKVVGLACHNDLLEGKQDRDNLIVIMAGGKGKRLKHLTKNTPKPMLKINDKPLLQLIVENCVKQGYKKIAISVNYLSEQIINHFGDGSKFGCEIEYLHEKSELGTAGALSLVRELKIYNSDLPMFCLNGDLLINIQFDTMLQYHNQHNVDATVGIIQQSYQVPYGVAMIGNDRIISIDEKPRNFYFINAGIYVFSEKIVDTIQADEYIDMPDLLNSNIQKGLHVSPFPILEYWKDIGRIEDYEKAIEDYEQHFAL